MSNPNEKPETAPGPIAEAPTSETKATPAAPAELTSDLIAGMPEVTHSIPNGDTKPEAASNPPIELTDDHGIRFDPNVHKTDEKGNPVKNKAGYFYSKFIGRAGSARKAAGGVHASNGNSASEAKPKFAGVDEAPAAPAAPAEPEKPDVAAGMSLMILPMVDGIMQKLFSRDIALEKDDKEILAPTLAAYLRAKNAKDIPPGLALTMVALAVYLPKFEKPTVAERFVLITTKLKGWLGGGKAK